MELRNQKLVPIRRGLEGLSPRINELVKLFVRSHLSPNTKEAYGRDVTLFFAYCQQEGWCFRHPREISSKHLQQYRDHLLHERKLASNSVIRKLVAVRGLLQYCVHEGVVDRNPLLNVRLPKAKQVMSTQDFSDDEVKAILALPRDDRPSGAMHGLVLTLLFYLGLRKAEVIGIRVGDFFEERGHSVLRIKGKGDKHRDNPLVPFVRRAVDHYMRLSGKKFSRDSFLLQAAGADGHGLHPGTIDWIVKHYSRKAGIKKRVSPHSCRASVVGNLLDNRVPIRDVANLVGHASIQTTSLYDKRKQNLDKSAAYQVRY